MIASSTSVLLGGKTPGQYDGGGVVKPPQAGKDWDSGFGLGCDGI